MILSVSGLSVEFDGTRVFPPLSFTLQKGETLVVLGPNGAGKTVLLRALLGLVPCRGSFEWKEGIQLGYVPQRVPLTRDLPVSVEDFFALKRKRAVSTWEALRGVGFHDPAFLKKQVGVLSSGQFQRVLIAWALAGRPDVLLFDEPTAGIDIGGEETIDDLLTRAQQQSGFSVILVTHDLSTVYSRADHVLCMNSRMFCYGSPQETLDSRVLNRLYEREVKYVGHRHV